ncbi:hypothetical protein ACFRCG_16525 [Embleya sp. NPDC056575]|uniref:hypothetical protein n=1 Tax=unclassified Embleya TaxID=2699296 RepID=UPI0036B758DE
MPTPGGFARRLAAGCVFAAVHVLPGFAMLASAAPLPAPAPVDGSSPPAERAVDHAGSTAGPRGRAPAAPGLRPDPPVPPRQPVVPTTPAEPAPITDAPTQQEWDRLLDRLARHGARPVTDESGQAVLDVERELLLTGGTEGLEALRSWGAEITGDDRPGVYAVRSGGRVVARYLMETEPNTSTDASAPATPPAFDAPPTLPRTGPSVVNLTLIALGGAGIVCAGGLLVRCSPASRRR